MLDWLRPCLPSCSAQDLSNTLFAVACLDSARPSPEWMEDFYQSMLFQLGRCR